MSAAKHTEGERTAPAGPRNGLTTEQVWAQRVRGSVINATEAQIQAITAECVRREGTTERGGVWHCSAVVMGRVDKCNCVPCRKDRGLRPVQL